MDYNGVDMRQFAKGKGEWTKYKTLGDIFSSVLALVDIIIRYMLLVGGGRCLVELVEVCKRRKGERTITVMEE
uniref:Putative ovule protein n=1 Tax=Solanum chacoense TaxID=4108 RepID=A0A0V0H2J4_SOLCH